MQKYTLRQARVLADLTKQEVAEKLNVAWATYNLIEKDPKRASIRMMEKIAKIFDIPYDALFFGSERDLK